MDFEFNILLALCPSHGESMFNFYLRLELEENKFITQAKSNVSEYGYNLREVANTNRGLRLREDALTRKGRKHSDKTKLLMSESKKGEQHPLASLDNEKVRSIKIMLAKGAKSPQIARYLNMDRGRILMIKSGASWGHILIDKKEIDQFNMPNFQEVKGERLTNKKTRMVQYLNSLGFNNLAISKYLKICVQSVIKAKRKELLNNNFDDVVGLVDLNVLDKRGKLPHSKGPKLNERSVLEIKKLLLQGAKQKDVAIEFGVHRDTIRKISKGLLWGHVVTINQK